jgi:hypothetical protein
MSPKSIVKISKVESLYEHLQEMEERIRIRAYERFVQRGGDPGRAMEDWCAASSELTAKPAIALSETETSFVVFFDLPDADVADLELLVADQAMLIRGCTRLLIFRARCTFVNFNRVRCSAFSACRERSTPTPLTSITTMEFFEPQPRSPAR